MRIYLAGGMRPRPLLHWRDLQVSPNPRTMELAQYKTWERDGVAWADVVQQYLQSDHDVFDPRVSNTKVFEDYSFIDLLELRQCDLVIAYLEAENPSGFGLAAEIAYAKGLGKTVLLINEKHEDRYVRFIENFADRVFHNLADAIPVIQKIRV